MIHRFLTELVNRYGQENLAKKVGVDGATLSRARSGQGSLNITVLERLMEAGGAVIISQSYLEKLKNAIEINHILWQEEKEHRINDLCLDLPEFEKK